MAPKSVHSAISLKNLKSQAIEVGGGGGGVNNNLIKISCSIYVIAMNDVHSGSIY